MQYMLLIYGEPGRWESAPEEERNEVRGRYVALAAELREREAYVDGNELQDARPRQPYASSPARPKSRTAPSPRRRRPSAATS